MKNGIGPDWRVPAMDGLRAIACLIVVLLHLRFFTYGPLTFQWTDWVPEGTGFLTGVPKIGVWLFFSLSAFLLSLELLNGLSIQRLYTYSVGRILRIAPPFLIALIVYRVIGTTDIVSWKDVWLSFSLQTSTSHLWTIAPEFIFYLFLPFIIAIALAGRRISGVVGAIFAILLTLGLAVAIWPPGNTPPSSMWTGWYAINFLSGVVAACSIRFLPLASPSLARLLLAFGLFVIIAFTITVKAGLILDPDQGLVDKHYVFGPMWSLVIYGAYIAPPRLLAGSALGTIGRWSFSIYLYHWGIGIWAGRLLPSAPALLVAVCGSILAGYLGYRLIERPAYSLRRALRAAHPPISR